ncbi:MAG TPA: NUMOD4 domain-containing protein [Urbifossiella sp.]|jgi:hypothetical protein|nr:NUMOD4 domain-containing protein [Urbifossiella sp.]
MRRGWCNAHYKRWQKYGDPLGCHAPLACCLPGERWRPVVGWEDLYAVSDLARVQSFHTHGRGRSGGLMVLSPTPFGYLTVGLSRGGVTKTRLVHHLVLEAFVSSCPPGMEACHGAGLHGDNRLVNLTWGTKAKNCGPDKERDGTLLFGETQPNAKLTEATVTEIRTRYAAGETQAVLAREFGISRSAVSMAASGKRWAHLADGVAVPEHAASGEAHASAKLTWESATEIRRRCAAGEPQYVVGRAFGVRQSTVWAIVAGKTWKLPA